MSNSQKIEAVLALIEELSQEDRGTTLELLSDYGLTPSMLENLEDALTELYDYCTFKESI